LADTNVPDGDDDVAAAELAAGGGAAARDFVHLDPGLAAEPFRNRWGKGPRAACDAEIRASHSAVAHQGGEDGLRRAVHRHRQAETHAGDGGVDADEAGV